jgi:hypothetical protein
MLDLAERVWPEITDRKALLYRLARVGEDEVRARDNAASHAARRDRQRIALSRAAGLVEVGDLLVDAAWR